MFRSIVRHISLRTYRTQDVSYKLTFNRAIANFTISLIPTPYLPNPSYRARARAARQMHYYYETGVRKLKSFKHL